MQPIAYEQDCKKCHPLSVQLVAKKFASGKLEDAVTRFNKEPAPHREPEIVRGVLRERLLKFVQENPISQVEKNDQDLERLLRQLETKTMLAEFASLQVDLEDAETKNPRSRDGGCHGS